MCDTIHTLHVAWSNAVSLVFRRSQVRSSDLAKDSFVEIGNEIIPTAILSLPLIGSCHLLAKGCALITG